MQTLLWLSRALVFVFFLLFAFKNASIVSINLFFTTVESPLILVLLAFFAGGALLGVLSLLGTLLGLKRELKHLKRGQSSIES